MPATGVTTPAVPQQIFMYGPLRLLRSHRCHWCTRMYGLNTGAALSKDVKRCLSSCTISGSAVHPAFVNDYSGTLTRKTCSNSCSAAVAATTERHLTKPLQVTAKRGVLQLRKTEGKNSFLKRVQRGIPLIFSNEVYAVKWWNNGSSTECVESCRSHPQVEGSSGESLISGDDCKSEKSSAIHSNSSKSSRRRQRTEDDQGLVYIEDEEGNRYGTAYYCSRHPLITARILTDNVDETIDEHFFFERMRNALLQRRALRDGLGWLSPLQNNSACGINNDYCWKSRGGGFTSSYKDNLCSTSNLHTGKTPTLGTQEKDHGKTGAPDFFRLINSDGDELSGLIVDLFGEFVSVQPMTTGIDFLLPTIVTALQRLLRPSGIVLRLDHRDRLLEYPQQAQQSQQHRPQQEEMQLQKKQKERVRQEQLELQQDYQQPSSGQQQRTRNSAGMRSRVEDFSSENDSMANEAKSGADVFSTASCKTLSTEIKTLPPLGSVVVSGEVPDVVLIEEGGCVFPIDLLRGRESSWAYSRRELRRQVASLSRGKRILDLFCHTAGLGIAALRVGGACEYVGIESDAHACALALHGMQLNNLNCTKEGITVGYSILQTDVAGWLSAAAPAFGDKERFDIVVIDMLHADWRMSEMQQGRQHQQQLLKYAALLTNEKGYLVATNSSSYYTASRFFADVHEACAAAGKLATLYEEGCSGADFSFNIRLRRSGDFVWVISRLTCQNSQSDCISACI